MATVVGIKGQIVVEKSIRDALGLQPGYVAVQKLAGDHLEIFFFPPEHQRSLRGLLADKTSVSLHQEDWEKARETAWSKAAAESTQGMGE